MSRMVQCAKLGKEAEGLDVQPYPGDFGARIFENISKEAWTAWVEKQTMLINENRLSTINPEHRKFLLEEMKKYLFNESE